MLLLDELTLKLRKGEQAAVESPTVGDLPDDLLRDYERPGRKSLPQLKSRLKHFDELRRLKAASFRAALAEPVQLMMVIAFHTGARAGAILSLRWDRDWPIVDLVIHRGGRKLVDYRDARATGCKAAGLEGLRFHDLRRSGVRNLLDAGLDESSVMKILGHRTRAMLDRYNSVSVKDVKRAAKTMDEWFESKRAERPSKPAKPVQ